MKNIVITGANKRVGLHLCQMLSKENKVFAITREPSEALKSLINNCNISQIKGEFSSDFFDESFWQKNFTGISIDSFIHCAATFFHDSVHNSSKSTLLEQYQVNTQTFIDACVSFYQSPNQEKTCDFIAIGDSQLHLYNENRFSYGLSKIQLVSTIKYLSQHLSPKIRVNCISPGIILPDPNQSEKELKNLQENFPYGKGASVNDLYQTVQLIINIQSFAGQIFNLDAGEGLR